MCRLASELATDTREPRLCAALRAYAVPSSGFVMQPHEDPLPPHGFLDFEPRGQFEARPLLVLGSLVSAVEDGGFQVRNSSAYVRLLQKTVPNPPRPQAGP